MARHLVINTPNLIDLNELATEIFMICAGRQLRDSSVGRAGQAGWSEESGRCIERFEAGRPTKNRGYH